VELTALLNLLPNMLSALPGLGMIGDVIGRELMSQIDAARNLPKFAKGGSFSTSNSNLTQFISGDSVNNRINPEKVTID
jgi:hypothetical protein